MTDRIAQLESTSAILGEYMLRGWALTDLACDECHVTPLMREPAALAAQANRPLIQFCATCDGKPDSGPSAPTISQLPPPLSTLSPDPSTVSAAAMVDSPFGPIPLAGPSRSPLEPPKSDPSENISSLLLQGYSLLADNCPNPICRGIPLVGYPKRKDGSKDGRRICVSCNGAWVDEADMRDLVPVVGPPEAEGQGGESPRSKARRELYETGMRIVEQQGQQDEPSHLQEPGGIPAGGSMNKGKGREIANNGETEMDVDLDGTDEDHTQPASTRNSPALDGALTRTTEALGKTLDTLSGSLGRCALASQQGDTSRFFVDVKLHTEAIKDVLGVVEMIDRLRG